MENILGFLVFFIEVLRSVLLYALFFWVIMSWFSSAPSYFGNILNKIIEPLVYPFRWAKIGMIDLSPILVILTLNYGGNFLIEWMKGLTA